MQAGDVKSEAIGAKRRWLVDTIRRFNFIATMRERNKIRRLCVELLKLYRQVEIEMPQASSRERYSRVVEKYSGAEPGAVLTFMRRAEESLASWPIERRLNLQDIVVYMAVTDGLKTDLAVAGVRSRLVDSVFDIVPEMVRVDL